MVHLRQQAYYCDTFGLWETLKNVLLIQFMVHLGQHILLLQHIWIGMRETFKRIANSIQNHKWTKDYYEENQIW